MKKIIGLILVCAGLIFLFKVQGMILAVFLLLAAGFIHKTLNFLDFSLKNIPGNNFLEKISNFMKQK